MTQPTYLVTLKIPNASRPDERALVRADDPQAAKEKVANEWLKMLHGGDHKKVHAQGDELDSESQECRTCGEPTRKNLISNMRTRREKDLTTKRGFRWMPGSGGVE